MNVVEFVKAAFAENDEMSKYDIREGTNLYEMLIKPIEYLLTTKLSLDVIDTEKTALDLSNYKNLTLSQMKRLAANHLVTERKKNETTGTITLHFTSPVSWSIEAGDKLYSDDVEFEFTDDVVLYDEASKYTVEDGNYTISGIRVKNLDGTAISEDTLGSVDGAPAELIKITHSEMVNGTEDYTVDEYHNLIRASLGQRQLMSKQGIEFAIRENFGGINSIDVIGEGDDLMMRDLLYNTLISDGEYNKKSDFVGKLKGNVSAVANRAFMLFRKVDDLSAEIHDIDGIEFGQYQYNKIAFEDTDVITLSTDNILNESFTQSSEVIGKIENTLNDIGLTDTIIHLDSYSGFEEGNTINIIDPTDDEPTRINLIKAITSVTYTEVSTVGATETIEIPGDKTDIMKVGMKMVLSDAGADDGEYIATGVSYDDVSEQTEITVASITSDHADCSVTFTYMEVYNNINGVYTVVDGCYIENVISEGFNIGNGWIKSEHGMGIGGYMDRREVMVIDGELVFGTISQAYSGNLIAEMISRAGIPRFMKAVIESTGVVFSKPIEYQEVVVNDGESIHITQ